MDTYKGAFNWKGELITLYTNAVSEKKAKMNLLHQLADKLGQNYGVINRYFVLSGKDRYKIEKE